MKQYHNLLKDILDNGQDKNDRTGVGTRSIHGTMLKFDLAYGFPAVTTKKLAWKSVVSELLWFLEGSWDERRLAEIHYGKDRTELRGKKTIWTDNADNQGKALGYSNDEETKVLGPIYGAQWRNWNGNDLLSGEVEIDQIETILNQLRNTPESRRIILSSWNVPDIDHMALPPCHVMAQFLVHNGKLDCIMYQRSVDTFLGLPFNIASYALLTHILAKKTGLNVGVFTWMGGDTHIYNNHFEQVKAQLARSHFALPQLGDFEDKPFEKYTVEDFKLEGYTHHETISAPMAV